MKSLFAWPGGKSNLLQAILARIPAHRLYVEVFSGSAKVLFGKEPSFGEVLNDINGDVINFYRVVKHRSAELAELLEHELVHPDRFRELKADRSADELHRALSFAYSTWYSYGAKGDHFAAGNLGELLRGGSRRPLDTVRELLDRSVERLRRVRLEQRDFLEILTRFDSPDTFFYLDPPYVHFGSVGQYSALPAESRDALFSTLAGLKGDFLLSFDDCEEVRELAGHHRMMIDTVETRYGLGHTTDSRKKLNEVFITPRRRRKALALAA